ncbi:MAG: hypothetical protein ABTD50_19935 [Polyangiaceae bacterium]|jgi:hypothetical protein
MNSQHVRNVAVALCLAAQTWTIETHGQVTDAERAAARQLFREGDELQRAGKVADALDKFQRAQQAYPAPTNVLRIAECQVALGHLVESAESYRAVLRAPLPPDAPPAFLAALEQAKGELAQVEPRIPRLRVAADPAHVVGTTFRIDGQPVSAALLGERIPLDPGPHRVQLAAPGYAPAETTELLRERDDKVVRVSLGAAPGAAGSGEAPLPILPVLPPAATSTGDAGAPREVAPPPPYESPVTPLPRPLSRSILLGVHLGGTIPVGTVPTDRNNGTSTEIGNASLGGLALGLDAGVRLARRWYFGATVETATLGSAHGADKILPGYATETSTTSLFEIVAGFIANPDKPSFFGELGAGVRWYTLVVSPGTLSATGAHDRHQDDTGPELTVGGGLWIPAGRYVRLLPELTAGFGTFQTFGGDQGLSGHAFITIGLAGFYNADF